MGSSPIVVGIPNGSAIRSTQEHQLQMYQLPSQAQVGHILPGLARHSLIYIGNFCDAGCTAEFTSHTVYIKKGGNILIRGWRDPTGLWNLKLTNDNTDTKKNMPEHQTAYHTTTKAKQMQVCGLTPQISMMNAKPAVFIWR